METMDNTGFDEFFGAFEGEDGNQTDTTDTSTEETEPTEEATNTEMEDDADGEEAAEEESDQETEEDSDDEEDGEGAAEQNPDQKFTIKVNKETREVSLSEITELAQKGADYDRVKGQLDTSRQNEQSLQSKLDAQKPFMDFLELAAEHNNSSVEAVVETLHINLLKSQGMSEAEAKATIRADKAEKQVKDLSGQKNQAEQEPAEEGTARAQREIEEFTRNFPDVKLSDELVAKMEQDLRAGMSLTSAYLKLDNAQKAAEIAALQKKQAASAQNKKNRAKTPGSQRDSGGMHKRDSFDDFFDAFEK